MSCSRHEASRFSVFFLSRRDQVARYFGFAQQVGLELGPLMPEGLRYTIAFVSSLVMMTLNLDQVSLSFSILFAFRAWCRCGSGTGRRSGGTVRRCHYRISYGTVSHHRPNAPGFSRSNDAAAVPAVLEPLLFSRGRSFNS